MKQQLKQTYEGVEAWVLVYFRFVLSVSRGISTEFLDLLLGRDTLARRAANRGQVDSIITVVIIGVVAVIGLLVFSEVSDNLSLDVEGGASDPANATTLEAAAGNVSTGFGDAVDLVPIVMIVLVAALVIGVISRFR